VETANSASEDPGPPWRTRPACRLCARHAITLDDRRASRSTGHRFIAGGDPGLL
jgi:hypothetical protein